MTLELKNLADLENTHHFTFPMVIMRQIISKEEFLSPVKMDMPFIYGTLYILAIVALVCFLVKAMYFFIFLSATYLLCFLLGFLTIIFRPKIIKRQLKELETLKSTTPFIILDKEKLEVYDHKGAVVRRFKTANIKSFRFWEKSHGRGYRSVGFKITCKDSPSFIYNITKEEKWTTTFYLEYDGDLYYGGGYYWVIGNMIDMLNKDPNAESFPFRRKNYINQRNWDDP